MNPTRVLSPRARFFFDLTASCFRMPGAGEVHTRRAEALAEAELLYRKAVRRRLLRLDWEHDTAAWHQYSKEVHRGEREPGVISIERCSLMLDVRPLASQRGIESPDKATRRLVRAELVMRCKDVIHYELARVSG